MDPWDVEDPMGPGTIEPPAEHQNPSPGSFPEYGPNFVRFVIDRFAAVEQLMGRLLAVLDRKPKEGWRRIASGQTDSSGNATITLLETNPTQKFALHRLYVHAEGYTWIAPFTGSGMLQLQLGNSQAGISWDGYSLVAGSGQLPAVFTASRLSAVEAQDGETLLLKITTGPASTRIEVRLQGVLSTVHGDDV